MKFWPHDSWPKLTVGTYSPHLPFNALRLNKLQQRYHTMVVGKSGSGKSRFLQAIALGHIRNSLRVRPPRNGFSWHGLSILDPHHDLALDILKSLIASGFYSRPDAYERVVYLDFGREYFTPFNVLDVHGDKHKWAERLHGAMVRVWPELEESPTFSEFFQSACVVLMENNLPITFMHRLFTQPEFRRQCLKRVGHDEVVWDTFARFEALGRDQEQVAGATIRRAFQLVFHPDTKLCLGQPENRLPLRQYIDEGRVLILNLAGVMGEARRILGALLMVQLEQAALSRIEVLDQDSRVQHTAIVDEWPTFAATEKTLSEILSQTRKFGLNIYLACQSFSQIGERRLAGAFDNCNMGVYFMQGDSSAEVSARQVGELDPYAIKPAESVADEQSDLRSPTSHNQYMPLPEQIQLWTNELRSLSPRYCYININGPTGIKIKTIWTPRASVSDEQVNDVLSEYRRKYQNDRQDAEAAIRSISLSGVADRDDAAIRGLGSALDWR